MVKKILLIMLLAIVLMVFFVPVALASDGDATMPFDFWAFITQESYVLIPVLYIIGWALKQIPKMPDWFIPWGLLIIGIPMAMALSGWNIHGAIQGVLVVGVTVLGNQIYKQTAKKRLE